MKQIKDSTLSTLLRSGFLALCLSCGITAGTHAQVAYNFQAPDDIPAITGAGHTILTMDCLAANGYGQWTSSSSSTNSTSNPACFLLSNKLNKISVSITDDAQAGVLAARQFNASGDAYPNEAVKCAANLAGNVRYVWMDNSSGRTKFYVEGFDPATSTNASTGIGIDFVSLPSSSSQKIVKDGSAKLYGEYTIPGSGTLVGTTNEPLYPDMFDIAIDASYLYIVWEQYAAGTYTIKAVAINLTGTFSPTFLGLAGTGRRPTVSVDVRHSSSVADIDVAYINSLPAGQVEWTSYNGSGWNTAVPAPIFVTGQTWSWINPTHARVLDASTPSSGTSDKAIYFIAQDNTGKVSLYFARITGGTMATSADYCDGKQNTDRADPGSPYVCPIETSTGYDVIDDYIRAFINPYDGSNTSGAFNHFNCLYVLNRSSGTTGGKYPLMIIQGSDPDSGYCVSGGMTTASFPYDDPVQATTHWPYQYVGAANQMGIHVHWTGLNTGDHYYRRDAHAIHQYIEENTLLTDACEVSANATLTNKWLTLYSDPDATSGYTGSCALTIDNDVTLAINPSGGNGVLVQLGAALINFDGLPGGILEVDPDDTMDFYCNTHGGFTGIGEFKFTGSGESITVGGAYGNWPDDITHPATLNIHGGTVFEVGLSPFFNYFTSYDAVIHFNSETNVVAGTTGTAQGKLILVDHSSFTNCWLISDDNIGSDNPTVIQIDGNGTTGTGGAGTENGDYTYSGSLPCATDTFNYCFFGTGDYAGHATISLLSPTVAPNALTINNGLVEGVSIIGLGLMFPDCSPYWPISITDVTFRRVVQVGMDFSYARTPSTAPSEQYSLLVDHCGFQWFDNSHFSNPDGIEVEAAPDASLEDAPREAITITNNTFESSYGESDGSVEAAIHFSDCTGDIGYNNISGSKYQTGIWNESSTATSHDMTWTLICSNTITGLTNTGAAGLSTDYYKGYAKLNSITGCYYGHLAGIFDNDNDLSSTYTSNVSYGYYGTLNSITDMTGVHHTGGVGDVAGYNVIKSNNSGGIQIGMSGATGNTIYLGLEPGSPTWPTTAYGLNDIEGTTDICGSSALSLLDISNNYWGGGAFTLCTGTTGTGLYLTTAPGASGFSCSGGLITDKRFPVPQSVTNLPDSSCGALFLLGYELSSDPSAEPAGYDTLRLFLEQCPFYGDSVKNGPDNSWDAFNFIGGAVSAWTAGGPGRWPDFLAFLKQVLYLNPDTSWYCQDVGDMISAEQSDLGMQMAEFKYLIDNNRCPEFTSVFRTELHYDSINQHKEWLDSIITKFDTVQYYGVYSWWVDSMVNKDTLANPYSSTVPSLFDVNLQILLGPQYANAVQPESPITSQALLNATLLDNPMQDEIDVSFEMGRTALITMELRDILGRAVPLTYAKYQLEQPGTHSAHIPAPNLPQGTYYLRITTDTGDVITLKVVKQ